MDRSTSLRDPGRPSVGDLQSESGVWGRGWEGSPGGGPPGGLPLVHARLLQLPGPRSCEEGMGLSRWCDLGEAGTIIFTTTTK